MTISVKALVASISVAFSAGALAAPTAEQIKQLGTTLTPWGAEIAGNKDGTIPAYTGGVKKAPAGANAEEGRWADPFADDKVVHSIDAKNMAQYGDKVAPGLQALMKRYPSFRIDVYPTHRSYPAQPKAFADAAMANAKNAECKTVSEGVGIRGCVKSIPFPIPSTGYEAMWNHQLRVKPIAYANSANNLVVDGAGTAQAPYSYIGVAENPYNDSAEKAYEGIGEYYYRGFTKTTAPAREAGNTSLIWYPLKYDEGSSRVWTYSTGQRRVRLAPEFAYDTPVGQLAGVIFYDEAQMFSGRMDKFDFKLLGRKEIYVPYNSYKALFSPIEKIGGKNFIDPDVVRFELHRVWVVEATLKAGQRHAASKRHYYIDEDSWHVLMSEGFDQGGKIFRVQLSNTMPNYFTSEGLIDFVTSSQAYDLTKGSYAYISSYGTPNSYYKVFASRSSKFSAQFSPEAVAAAGVR